MKEVGNVQHLQPSDRADQMAALVISFIVHITNHLLSMYFTVNVKTFMLAGT